LSYGAKTGYFTPNFYGGRTSIAGFPCLPSIAGFPLFADDDSISGPATLTSFRTGTVGVIVFQARRDRYQTYFIGMARTGAIEAAEQCSRC
jgi:hypothetical protein